MTKYKAHSQSFCRACYAHKIGKGEPCKKHCSSLLEKTKESKSLKQSDVCKRSKEEKSLVCDKHAKMTLVQSKPCDHKTSSKMDERVEQVERVKPIEIDDIQLSLTTKKSDQYDRPMCPAMSQFCPPSFCPPRQPHPPPNPNPIPPPNPNPTISILQQENEQLRQQLIVLQQQNDNLADTCQQNYQNTVNELNAQAEFELELQAQQQKELEMLSQMSGQETFDPQAFLPAATKPTFLDYQLSHTNVNDVSTVSDLVNSIQVHSSQLAKGVSADPNAKDGYFLLDSAGNVKTYGKNKYFGSLSDHINVEQSGTKAVGMVVSPSKKGYAIATSDGRVYTFGDFKNVGDARGYRLSHPIVGIVSTESGNGIFLVSSNGGVMAFGDGHFAGSSSSIYEASHHPIIGIYR